MNFREIFTYDRVTGQLFWVSRPKRFYKRSLVAGCVNSLGYVQISYKGKQYLAHRIIWEIEFGGPPEGWIDHIDGNRSNNKLENLRLASPKENTWNRRGNKNTTSRYKGVYYYKNYGKWHARFSSTHIGYFKSEEEAAKAYDNFVANFQGHFARPNFQRENLTNDTP